MLLEDVNLLKKMADSQTLMSKIIEKVQQFIDRHDLIKPHSTIIVGLSGGPDSVFLLHVLKHLQVRYGITLIAAHLDHQWRENSHRDLLFCKALAESMNCQFIGTQASTIALKKTSNGSREELGRLLRRQFFEDCAIAHNAQAIALAHHADDQQETFFVRLMRGATITGLSSIRPLYDNYIRPLLGIYKAEILEYLQQHNLPFLEDHTNLLDTFLRNRIRNQVIPALRNSDNRFDINFSKMLTHLQETELYLDRLTEKAVLEIIQEQDNTPVIMIEKFLASDPFLHNRLLLKWLCLADIPFSPSTAFFDEITHFLQRPGSGEHAVHLGWKIVKNNNRAYILS